jgi:anti-sigma B factor antagonist
MPGRLVWKITEVADLRGDRLLVLQGELDIATAPELSAMLARLRARKRSVVLDLADVTFMDSTGLTLLMDAWIDAERDGWAFSIRAASPAVRRVVALAGVERLIDGA